MNVVIIIVVIMKIVVIDDCLRWLSCRWLHANLLLNLILVGRLHLVMLLEITPSFLSGLRDIPKILDARALPEAFLG